MKWDEVFKRFNNTKAEILQVTDFDDYENKYNIEIIGEIDGDLQPYSGELLQRDYGLKKECQKRFFCTANDSVKEGTYFRVDGKTYIVEYVAEWEAGLTVMLRESQISISGS